MCVCVCCAACMSISSTSTEHSLALRHTKCVDRKFDLKFIFIYSMCNVRISKLMHSLYFKLRYPNEHVFLCKSRNSNTNEPRKKNSIENEEKKKKKKQNAKSKNLNQINNWTNKQKHRTTHSKLHIVNCSEKKSDWFGLDWIVYFSWIVDCRLTNDSPFERVNPVHFTRETSNFMVMSTKTSICNQYRNKLIFLHFLFIFGRSVPFKWAHFFNMCIFQKWSTSTINVLILQFLGQMMTQKCYRLFVICFHEFSNGRVPIAFFLFGLVWFYFGLLMIIKQFEIFSTCLVRFI